MRSSTTLSFIIAATLYTALVLLGYWLWTLTANVPTKEYVKPVPVTLAMFQEASAQPMIEPIAEPIIEPIAEEPKFIEPIKPVTPPEPVAPVKPIQPPKPQPKKESKPTPTPKSEPKPVEKPKKTPVSPPEPVKQKTAKTIEEQPAVAYKPVTTISTPQPITPKYSQQQIANAEQAYLNELRKQIINFAQDTYPRRAKRRGWEGEVSIEFVLTANGNITKLKILQSSGRAVLDQAALQIFQEKMQNRFKAFPKEITRSTWLIKVPVSYNLR